MTRRHLAALALAYGIFCALYLGASAVAREPIVLTPAGIDSAIPFLGWSIWVYLSQFPLLGIVFWKAAGSAAWGRCLRSMLVATLVSSAIFVALPTRLERGPVEAGAITMSAFAALYLFDPPGNCFPSLHVSLAILGALAFWPERRRLAAACLAWATLISVSTLTTRQHVLLDLAGGVAVAIAAHLLTRRRPTRQSCASSATPAAINPTPPTRLTRSPHGAVFSSSTSAPSAATHSRFITPATNSSAMRIQQHPTQ